MMYASPLRVPLIRTGRYGPRDPILLPGEKVTATVHEGVDVRAAVGTPVYPTIAGVVSQVVTGWLSPTRTGTSFGRSIFRPGAGGNQVVVRGDDGRDHNFGHLSRVLVKPGQRVHLGDQIAVSGTSGVYAPHLHYGIWLEYVPNRWRSLDPTPLLPWDGDKFGELKIADKAASAVEEDDVALTEDEKWTLEELRKRIKQIDEDHERLEQLFDRRARLDATFAGVQDLRARVGVIDDTKTVVDELFRRAGVDVDEQAVAEAVAARLSGITAEQVQQIAEAVADEHLRRLAD